MDKTTLDSLRLAYSQSPENATLGLLLAKGLADSGAPKEAVEIVVKLRGLGDADKLAAARIALVANEPKQALAFLDAETADALFLKAKACLLTLDHLTGLTAYKKAVALNPALEDQQLMQSLSSSVTEAKGGDNVVGFKVIKNERPPAVTADGDDGEFGQKPAVIAEDNSPPITFAEVGSLDEVKKIITRKIILPFQKPELLAKYKRSAGGGVLMYGPPGCGKTLMARATAGECKAKFYNVAISDVLDMWLGNSEKRLHALFEQARRTAPSVLFFDELEGLAGKRQYEGASAGSRAISQFLTEMDGFSKNNAGVLIIGATNVPWAVDAAFRRPGRFDRVQFIPPPDLDARRAIFEIHLAKRPIEDKLDLNLLAKSTSGFSGADIEHVVDTACDLAIEDALDAGKEIPVSMKHLSAAVREQKPTTAEWLATVRNYARYSNEGGQYDEVLEFLNRHGK